MNEIMNINGIECYEKEGTAYLKLETVARGLGFTRVAASGNEVVRWETVRKYLSETGVPTNWHGDSPQVGNNGLPEFIPENIFYRLAMKAKNAAAETFQAKVADEIIPSIRKTGGYVNNDDLFISTYLPYADDQTKALFKSTLATVKNLNSRIEQMRPKEIFADAVSVSDDSILIGALAKIIKQNGVEIGQKRLFNWMRDHAYLMKSGRDYNLPTQKAMELGLFKIKERTINNPDGSVRITKTVLVTGKGQQYFINKFLAN